MSELWRWQEKQPFGKGLWFMTPLERNYLVLFRCHSGWVSFIQQNTMRAIKNPALQVFKWIILQSAIVSILVELGINYGLIGLFHHWCQITSYCLRFSGFQISEIKARLNFSRWLNIIFKWQIFKLHFIMESSIMKLRL